MARNKGSLDKKKRKPRVNLDMLDICLRRKAGESYERIARVYNTSVMTIRRRYEEYLREISNNV